MQPIPSPYSIARLLVAFLLFLTIWCGRINYTFSDPQLTLLTAQAIVEHGSINLYRYQTAMTPEQFSSGKWKYTTRQRPETLYYSYPIGTSFFAIPVVAVANFFGLDMANSAQDAWLQCLLAALTAVILFLLSLRSARLLLDEWPALLLAVLLSFGTSYMSSVGTALWSFNLELIAVMLILHLVLRVELRLTEFVNPYSIATLLFIAWFCRPSVLVFVLLISVWMFIRQRNYLLNYLGTLLALFLLFILFSLRTYELFLPTYYNPFVWTYKVDHGSAMLTRIAALLMSPARGLFLFTPFLLLGFWGLATASLRNNRIWQGALVWFVLQLLITATAGNWWGGWCFGPRLLTDALPPLMLLLALTLNNWLQQNQLRRRLPLLLLLGGFSIFVHTVQGLYNSKTVEWNDNPNIDTQSEFYMWNWKQPQFLASNATNTLKKRELELGAELDPFLKLIPKGGYLLYGQPDNNTRTIFERWNANTNDVRVYNNLYAIEKTNKDTFWITALNLDQIRSLDYYTLVHNEKPITLGDYLRSKQQYTVLLSVRDEGMTSLSDATRTYFREKGSRLDSLKFRQGYTALFRKGQLIEEHFENGDSAALNSKNGIALQARSCGNNTGNHSVLRVNGRDYSPNARGFNVLVITAEGKLIETAHFDTHTYDAEIQKVFAVMRAIDVQKRK